MRRDVVAITGASSGIGRSLALSWAARGASLVLSARNEVALASVAREVDAAGGEAFVEAGDVTSDAHRVKIVERALREKGRLDVLVNNAGRGYYAPTLAVDPDELAALFALNVIAPLRLAQLAVPALTETRGAIVMLSSVVGIVAAPRVGAYAASKFALEAISMSLRAELRKTGVRVLVVRPGPVETPFSANATTAPGGIGYRPPGARKQSPDEVAEMILDAVKTRRAVLETSAFVRVASLAARTMPATFRWVSARIAARSGF